MTKFVEIKHCGGQQFHINPNHVVAVIAPVEEDGGVTTILMSVRQKPKDKITDHDAQSWEILTYEDIAAVLEKLG